MKSRALLAGATAFLACTESTSTDAPGTRVEIALSTGTTAAALASGPFVSVIDSLDFRASSHGTSHGHFGRRLSRYQAADSVSFTVPEGTVTFDVEVFSSVGTLLYTGTHTTNVSGQSARVTIPLVALRPVLVVQPDTVKSSGPQTASFTIYNAGSSSLAWSLAGSSPAISACGAQCTFSQVLPVSGQLTRAFSITVPPPFASGVFAFDLSSAEGTVRVVWDYTAPVVSSVTLSPKPALVAVGGTVTLGAQVASTGTTAVSWTSAGPPIATVSASGVVAGVSSGSTMVHAVSQVTSVRRDSALVRVHTPYVGSWSINAPTTTDTVHRDGPGGALTKVISAVTSGPTAVYLNPFINAEFWGRPLGGTTWIRLGQAPPATLVDNGITRSYTYSLTWNPDAITAPFSTPSTTRLELIAIGLTNSGAVRSSPLNTSLWVVVP